MTYRPYQEAGVHALYTLMRSNQRVLGVLPTGGGKTVIAELIARHAVYRKRTLYFGVHRRNLVEQTTARFEAAGLHCGVIMAGDARENPDAPVQVFSIDTAVRRDVPEPGLLMLDEAHNLAKHAPLVARWPNARVIGLTATPVGKLGTVYQAMHVIATPSQLLADGWLCDLDAWGLVTPDLTGVATSGDDYQQAGAEKVVMEALEDVVKAWHARAAGLPTLAFAQSVRHSLALRDAFRTSGVVVEHVDSTTKDAERVDIFARFKAGAVSVVLNYDIISEGYDAPDCRCVLLARATKSPRVFLQQVGRGLRPLPGKRLVLLDCAGNVKRLWWPLDDVPWELDDSPAAVKKKMATDPIRSCEVCYRVWRSKDGPACPYCGWTKPEKKIRAKSRGRGTARIERSGVAKPVDAMVALEVAKWRAEAERRGYKPGYVKMRFRARFGRWPTKGEV